MQEIALRAHVQGRVQGVGFRWFVQRAAEELGLRGYTRNLADGSVEVVAAGDPTSLGLLLQRLQRGPRGARVDAVRREDLEPVPDCRGFEIRA